MGFSFIISRAPLMSCIIRLLSSLILLIPCTAIGIIFVYQHVYMNCTQLQIIRMHELYYTFQR
jgi:hypothetical protein